MIEENHIAVNCFLTLDIKLFQEKSCLLLTTQTTQLVILKKAHIFNGKHNKTYPHQEKNNFQNITNPQAGYVFEVAPSPL